MLRILCEESLGKVTGFLGLPDTVGNRAGMNSETVLSRQPEITACCRTTCEMRARSFRPSRRGREGRWQNHRRRCYHDSVCFGPAPFAQCLVCLARKRLASKELRRSARFHAKSVTPKVPITWALRILVLCSVSSKNLIRKRGQEPKVRGTRRAVPAFGS